MVNVYAIARDWEVQDLGGRQSDLNCLGCGLQPRLYLVRQRDHDAPDVYCLPCANSDAYRKVRVTF